VGNGGVAKWEMTDRTEEPLLQNLAHHIQMLTYFTNHNYIQTFNNKNNQYTRYCKSCFG